eukprot:TRINITY_DN6792_c0_g1_i1.p1 TRINITY_DN6792_c0_g1~~TRINITY_DN6792_c0_g1_i1.p1  ORF type:complete len:378 (+),score=54.70 TRINITY_DN6792_c0_g1_i1:171-1136(+)
MEWKSSSNARQDDTRSTSTELGATPSTSSKSEQSSSSSTPPEAWGGEGLSDKFPHLRHPFSMPLRSVPPGSLTSGSLMSGSIFSGLPDSASTSHIIMSSQTNANFGSADLHGKVISNLETPVLSESSSAFHLSSISTPLVTNKSIGQANLEFPGSVPLTLPRRLSTYAERMSTTSSFSDGASLATGSPKPKKTGAETREELINSMLWRSDTSAATSGAGILPTTNGTISHPERSVSQTDQLQGTSSFTLQLVQRTLEETLTSVQKSIHEDVRNLHIELLRQFHIHETEMSTLLNSVLEKQAELMKEVQSLRKENQQLRQLL